MLIQYVLEVREFPQLKMWIEITVGVVVWSVIAYYSIKLIDDIKMKKMKRGYNPDEDKGRKFTPEAIIGSGVGYRENGTTDERKSELQDALEHAKQELLQGGASGSDTSDSTDTDSTDTDA